MGSNLSFLWVPISSCLGGGFVGPGGGFRTSRSSGKATAGTCAKKEPRTIKTAPRTTESNTTEKAKLKTPFEDSRHALLSTYAVFDGQSDVQVKNQEIRRPEAKK